MSTLWLVVALGVAGAVVAFVASRQRRDGHRDLGAVSHQWISEHRQQGHDHRP